ncbi:MAG: replication initiation protein [Acutalibacteraceae bacterium]|nr:replication initiation protein [Acutalibacteraceae bacterium]
MFMLTDKQKRALNKGLTVQEYHEDVKATKQYEAVVRKSNTAVQKARYSLTLRQQKLLCLLISQIREDTTAATYTQFNLREVYDILGDTTQNYYKAKQELKDLADKSWWIVSDKNKDEEVLVRFLSKVITNKNTQTVKILWDIDMLPHLQNLRREYTQYKLFYILTMKSEYTVRIYELLKSVAGKTNWNFKIEQLKKLLMCDTKYKQFGHFKARVIDTAVNEINEKTDINVSYELFRYGGGREYTDIEFTIETKEQDDLLRVNREITAELNRDQIDGQLNFNDM